MLSARQSIGIIALTVSLSPILPFLVQHGMFMDGTQYAIVSRNLAAGEGTFWFPSLSPSWYRAGNPAFMEQPPLFYFLESLVFRITGDTIFAERIFCAVCLLITVILLRANWRILNTDEPQQKTFWWLPASLFLITPTIFWCYRNNMIEMAVTVFVLATSYFILHAIISNKPWLMVPAAFFLFAGSFCKGVPALFPAVMPLLWYVTHRRGKYTLKTAVLHSGTLFAIPAIIYALILLDPTARESLRFYFFERLLGRISDEPTVNSRFSILASFAQEFAVMFLIWLIVRFVLRRKPTTSPSNNRTLFLLLSGASGIVPLVLTPVQRPFYMVPALSFFALALAMDLVKRFNFSAHVSLKTQKRLMITAAACAVALIAFTLTRVGKISRDERVLADIHAISEVVPDNGNISTSFAIYSKWDLQFYLLRYHGIVLESGPKNEYLLKEKTEDCDEGFEPCQVTLNELSLCCHRRE